MIHVTYYEGAAALPRPSGQAGGFENAEGSGEIRCFSLLDGVTAMLMRLEMESYTELRRQTGLLELNFCVNGRFETRFSLRDHVLLKSGAMATPVGLLVLLFVFDWLLVLLSLIPVILGFVIMSAMTGKRMAEKMRQYGNALAAMSGEAVEYVRGIPVVKTFGQSVFSFKKFKATIDEYEK